MQYTAQVCAILFVVGLLLNRVSGYAFVYIIGESLSLPLAACTHAHGQEPTLKCVRVVFAILLLPGIYTHGVFGKLLSLAESHPQVGRAMGMAREQYAKRTSLPSHNRTLTQKLSRVCVACSHEQPGLPSRAATAASTIAAAA
jgi:hypothetical protein